MPRSRANTSARGELTAYYVVQLLAGFLERPGDDADDEPLAFQLARALESGGPAAAGQPQTDRRRLAVHLGVLLRLPSPQAGRRRLLRQHRRQRLRRAQPADRGHLLPVFAELADNFIGFVDVLSEVSERSSCGSNTDLLRLYERWLKTGSPRSGQLLVEQGVVPNASFRGSRIQ